MSHAAAHQQAVFAVLKVSCIKFLTLQELGALESQTLQFVLQLTGIEEQLKGLSISGHTFRECIPRDPLSRIEQPAIDREIKYHSAVRGHSRNEGQSAHAGFAREIGCHAKP